MSTNKASKVVVTLIALALVAPVSTFAGSYGHHGHGGHYGYYGHHGYYGHYGYHGYSTYPYYGYTRFYDQSGQLYRGATDSLGALDLNVKPKNTQVYLNGRYIGVTGNFDGFPRYLWLKEGTYEVILYNEGYETVVHEFEIYPGTVIDVKQRLLPGDSVPPGELTSTGSPNSGSQPRRESGA